MNIDTNTIRRLRDGLVKRGSISNDAELDADMPVLYQQAVLERFTPFAETMYLMMLIDGHADSVELDAIRGAMQILTDGTLDNEVLNGVFKRCAKKAEEYGVEGRLQFIGAHLSTDRVDRETAFSLAAAVAIADNKLEEVEIALMESIAEWYGISSKRCKEILQDL
jgi:tellurite resistance protein